MRCGQIRGMSSSLVVGVVVDTGKDVAVNSRPYGEER